MMLPKVVVKWKTLVFAALAALIVLTGLFLWCFLVLSRETIYNGIYIEDTDVSGLSKTDAFSLLKKKLDEQLQKNKITLIYLDKKWELDLNSISFGLKLNDAVEQAYTAGRKGGPFDRLRKIADIRKKTFNVIIEPVFDRERLAMSLKKIKTQVDMDAVDATVKYENGSVVIEKEIVGKEMDIDTNIKIIENYILKKDFDEIGLCVDEKPPRVRYDEIKEIKGPVSVFSTYFNAGDVNRSHNIKLACERINNTVLLVNDIFSMNRALGSRTVENGYREAPVIYKNELIQGPGGGICQVTTTLYVAVLKSRLDIIERTPHSLPLGYVEPGQDATIAEGSIDFKFQNSLSYDLENYPVCINASVEGNKITIRILGKNSGYDHVVKLKSHIIRTFPSGEEIIFDENIPYGERVVESKGKNGMRVAVYREVYSKNGELIDREKVSEDYYKPVKARIRINPVSPEQLNE